MFDRESFKEAFDFTDDEVDKFIEACAGERIDRYDEDEGESDEDRIERPQDWIVVFTDDPEERAKLAELSEEKLREIFNRAG
jgi:hypothetical protein